MGFIDEIILRAKTDKKTIVLPESSDPRIVEACAKLLERGIAEVVMIGKQDEIQAVAPQWDVSAARFVDPENSPFFDAYASALYDLRKKKGMTLELARETMKNPLYFGVMMVKQNEADCMVAGAVNSTSDTLRPALQILKTAPGTKLVSAFFMIIVPECPYGHNGTDRKSVV